MEWEASILLDCYSSGIEADASRKTEIAGNLCKRMKLTIQLFIEPEQFS